jgi:hypothetical protein
MELSRYALFLRWHRHPHGPHLPIASVLQEDVLIHSDQWQDQNYSLRKNSVQIVKLGAFDTPRPFGMHPERSKWLIFSRLPAVLYKLVFKAPMNLRKNPKGT